MTKKRTPPKNPIIPEQLRKSGLRAQRVAEAVEAYPEAAKIAERYGLELKQSDNVNRYELHRDGVMVAEITPSHVLVVEAGGERRQGLPGLWTLTAVVDALSRKHGKEDA